MRPLDVVGEKYKGENILSSLFTVLDFPSDFMLCGLSKTLKLSVKYADNLIRLKCLQFNY